MNLIELSIAEAHGLLSEGTISAVDLVEAHLSAMEAGRELNAYVTETPDQAREEAKRSNERLVTARRKGLEVSPLEGIPVAIKDTFCTQGVKTTACSRMLAHFIPSYESTVTAKLRKAGAIRLGKTNHDEFAMGSDNLSSFFGPTINPWKQRNSDEPLISGGSSGGSAAAVSAGLAMGSLGTDTGGSIRHPAALCGVVGMKPTYGRCSRWGMIAYASSLDQAGPVTRNVADAALVLEAIAGFDPRDSTSAQCAPLDLKESLAAGAAGNIQGIAIGVPKELWLKNLPESVTASWEESLNWARAMGATIVDISLPHISYGIHIYHVIAFAEAASNLARYDGVRYGLRAQANNLNDMYEITRSTGFGEGVKRRILIGTLVLSSRYYDSCYLKAQKIRALIRHEFETAFRQVDTILAPATPRTAFPLHASLSHDEEALHDDFFTVPANLAGLPAMSLPVNLDRDGLPLSVQVIAKPFDEAMLFRVGSALEQAADFQSIAGKPAKMRRAL